MVNKRTLKVKPETLIKLKKIKGKILETSGQDISLTELVDKITKTPEFLEIEKNITKTNKLDMNLRFD